MRFAGSLRVRGEWRRAAMYAGAAAALIVLSAAASHSDPVARPADRAAASDARKQPMRFTWHSQGAARPALVAAVGTVTSETPAAFEQLARKYDLHGATMTLDSGGGSVLDTLTLGRRWRALGMATTVGAAVTLADGRVAIRPDAACESMCAFLLLAGSPRHVPSGARVRVHQIWMGDRAGDAQAASYTAQDMTIVQRDVGRLAQYTFEMGGSGTLLSLALSVPPWEPLHELSPEELVAANLVTRGDEVVAMPGGGAKLLQERLAVSRTDPVPATPSRLGKAADAATGGMAHAPAAAAP